MKTFFTWIAVHMGAKQLAGALALLGLALLLIPRTSSNSSVSVENHDDVAGLSGFTLTEPSTVPAVAGSGRGEQRDVSAPVGVKEAQNLKPASAELVVEPNPRTAPVLGFATASQKATQGSDVSGYQNAAAALAQRSFGFATGTNRNSGAGTSGGLSGIGGGGGAAGQGTGSSRMQKTDELVGGSVSSASSDSDASSLLLNQRKSESSHIAGSNATDGSRDQTESHASVLPTLSGGTLPPGSQIPELGGDGPAFASADLNVVPPADQASKAEGLAVAVDVPDAGYTFSLLAGAMVGLCAIRRRMC